MRIVLCSVVMFCLGSGCISLFMAQSPIRRADGTWHGSLEKVEVRTAQDELMSGVLLRIADGPELHDAEHARSKLGIITTAMEVVLVSSSGLPVPWSDDLPKQAEVTGALESGRASVEVEVLRDAKWTYLPRLTRRKLTATATAPR